MKYNITIDIEKKEGYIKELEHTITPRDVKNELTDVFTQIQSVIEIKEGIHLQCN